MIKTLFILFSMFTVYSAQANNAYDFDDYTVYYNAFKADDLPPQMAKNYGILRSKYKGVLNLSVQKKQNPGTLPMPVDAMVQVKLSNLAGQEKLLEVRKITEGTAIYYISEFRVANQERIKFDISILPMGEMKPLTFQFRREYFID